MSALIWVVWPISGWVAVLRFAISRERTGSPQDPVFVAVMALIPGSLLGPASFLLLRPLK